MRYFLFLFLVTFSFGQTGYFEITPKLDNHGGVLRNATVYIVNLETSDSLLLSERTGRLKGTYYRASTSYGTYKIYVQHASFNSGTQTLLSEREFFGSANDLMDATVDWVDLSNGLQTTIGGELYSYQDAAVNSAYQMPARWAHYLHERYYNEANNWYSNRYDQTAITYLTERRSPARYLWLLRQLHIETGRDIYWNKMLSLYRDLRDSTSTITYSGGGASALTCKSIIIQPDATIREDGWPYADVMFHLTGRYIYEQDNSYTTYNNEFLAFANVAHSYINKNLLSTGWVHGYSWDTAPSADQRINTSAPMMMLWAYMDKNSITADSLTAAEIDTTLDSIYAVMENSWVDDATSGGGGYELRIGDGTVDVQYINPFIMAWTYMVELYADTSIAWSGNMSTRLQKMAKFRMHDSNAGLLEAHNGRYFWYNLLVKEICDKWNIDIGKIHVERSVESVATNPPHFNGINYPTAIMAHAQRRGLVTNYMSLALLIDVDETLNTSMTAFTRTNWSAGGSANFYYDGSQFTERSYIGLGTTTQNFKVGYLTGDTSPGTDTTNWTFSNGVVTYSTSTVSTQNYTIKKRMGTSYSMLTPLTSSDTLIIDSETPGTATTDSVWFFYYNLSGILDTTKITSLAATTDSVGIIPNKGVWCNVFRSTAPSAGAHGVGFIANTSTGYLKFNKNYTGYRRITLVTPLADSAAVFAVYPHDADNGFLYDPSDWTYAFRWAGDVLTDAQLFWAGGINYIGILEDQTQ